MPDRTRIAAVTYPGKGQTFSKTEFNHTFGFSDIRSRYEGEPRRDGLIYGRTVFIAKKAATGQLRIGADGPYKLFVNRKEVACNAKATNPISAHLMTLPVAWKKGRNEIVIALRTNGGKAWGFMASTNPR